jgi:hypothetical protein
VHHVGGALIDQAGVNAVVGLRPDILALAVWRLYCEREALDLPSSLLMRFLIMKKVEDGPAAFARQQTQLVIGVGGHRDRSLFRARARSLRESV